ncbi:hypothetical protein G4B88_011363 [Cannabis sativa]|uniref:CCHC-type domain-containing protein n=1 Tax=Cannabis sativa TaxID=3483 RepID=A0A7J6GHJ8_CANSA|nr:hypothetical protein G4B88_011363 [Cannabis sativa]
MASRKGKEIMETVECISKEALMLSLEQPGEEGEVGADYIEKSVVGKVISKRSIFKGLLRNVLYQKWRSFRGWNMAEVEPNIYTIRFQKKLEAEMVVERSPWPVCGGHLILKPLAADGRWNSTDLNVVPIWVRVYDVPPRFFTKKNATTIANRIGGVISIDRMWKNGFPTAEYIRLRANIHLKKPLLVGLNLPMDEGVSLWCYFKYENLPRVCFKCGLVGHEEVNCNRRRRVISDDLNHTVPMYGPWMRFGSRLKHCFEGVLAEELAKELEGVHLGSMVTNIGEVEAPLAEDIISQRDTGVAGGHETALEFEPGLMGTVIHQEYLEGNAGTTVAGEMEPMGLSLEGQVASTEKGTDGMVDVEAMHTGATDGTKNVCREAETGVGGPTESQIGHLAMVFKGVLDPTNGSNSKLARHDCKKINRRDITGLLKPSGKPLLGPCPGKKRRLDDREGEPFNLDQAFSLRLDGMGLNPKKNCVEVAFESKEVVTDGEETVNQAPGEEKGDGKLNSNPWVGCFIYAPPKRSERDSFWASMSTNMHLYGEAWMVMGDMNAVLCQEEKIGGRPVCDGEGRGLRNFIFDNGAVELGGSGVMFTWTNGQDWNKLIKEKLDRVLCLTSWLSQFPKAGTKNLPIRHSDHSAIILNTVMETERFKAPFRYIDAWNMDEGCSRVVNEAWQQVVYGFQSYILCTKLRNTATALCKWNVECFGHCKKKLDFLEKGRFLALRSWESICRPKSCGRLGIRKFQDINFCLIAKLAWFLVSNHQSLLCRIFLGKYWYYHSNWSGGLGSGASPVVRGIWKTREFIRRQSLWIMGRFSNVEFWYCSWTCADGVIFGPQDLNPGVVSEEKLGWLRSDDEVWDAGRIERLFRPEAATSLSSCNINELSPFDSLIWHTSPTGTFSLKQAYWDLNSHRFGKDKTCLALWKLPIHERLKLFLWKIMTDCLPFGSRLSYIFGNNVGNCILCDSTGNDTSSHFLLHCPITQSLWRSSKWAIQPSDFPLHSGAEVITWMLFPQSFGGLVSENDKEEFLMFVAVMYHNLWFFRNDKYHNHTIWTLDEMKRKIDREFVQHRGSKQRSEPHRMDPPGIIAIRWLIPRPGRIRAHVDFANKDGIGAVGVVIRDESGHILAMYASKTQFLSIIHGELWAVYWGLKVMIRLGCAAMDIISDCQVLVVVFLKNIAPHWNISRLFALVKSLLVSFDVSLLWAPR